MTRSLPYLLLVLPPLAFGCQRYSPRPVDLGAYRAEVADRDPAGAAVVAYAQRLMAGSSESPVYDPSDGLDLHEAEVVALFFNPELRLARLRAGAARIGAAEAGRWEDPELSVNAERIVESVERPWVVAGTLSLTLPLSGRLGAERRLAGAEASAEELRALEVERRLLGALRREWVEWSASRERADLTRDLLEDLGRLAEQGERLRDAGELDPVQARLLRLELVRQTASLRRQDGQSHTLKVRLMARLGLLSDAPVDLIPALTLPTPPAPDAVEEAIQRHPRIAVARAEYDAAERRLALEIRKQYPNLQVGGGYGVDEGDERALLGLALPLPLLNANRRAIAQTMAARDIARATAEAAYEQLMNDAAVAAAQLIAAEAHAEHVTQELAPLADRQVQDVLRLGNLGDFNALVLLEALTAAHEAKVEVLEARAAVATARARLVELLEQPTAAPAPEAQP